MNLWTIISVCVCFLGLNLRADATPLTYHIIPKNVSSLDTLEEPIKSFRALHIPINTAFLSLSRSYPITFIVDPLMTGYVSLEMKSGTLRNLIEALTESQAGSWEQQGRLIYIHHTEQCFYEIDYPQMSRSAQGSSSVVLTAQTGSNNNASNLANTNPSNTGQNTSNAPSDQTNLSIQQQNQTTFWTDVLAELTGMCLPGENIAINKLAGLAIITAPKPRQKIFKAFIELLNKRISRQVRITAKILEVSLDDQHQLGIDWALATQKIGSLNISSMATATGHAGLLSSTVSSATVSGTLALGQVSAVVNALNEQGSVKSESNPSIVTLGNQTAFVKVGTEQTFFSLTNATSISSLITTAGVNPTAATQNNYTQNAITIGTVLYVTPEINTDGSVTVDVLPAITQLTGVDTSPDGLQTAPRMDIKALSTIARLHANESIMIGGLIQTVDSQTTRKTPGLGSIPNVGNLFSKTAKLKTRTELVIFLTAEVIP